MTNVIDRVFIKISKHDVDFNSLRNIVITHKSFLLPYGDIGIEDKSQHTFSMDQIKSLVDQVTHMDNYDPPSYLSFYRLVNVLVK